MHNKGFITVTSIVIFNLVLTFSLAILSFLLTSHNVLISMQEVNENISEEALLIQHINCMLLNEQDPGGTYYINDKSAYVASIGSDELSVSMDTRNFIFVVYEKRVVDIRW